MNEFKDKLHSFVSQLETKDEIDTCDDLSACMSETRIAFSEVVSLLAGGLNFSTKIGSNGVYIFIANRYLFQIHMRYLHLKIQMCVVMIHKKEYKQIILPAYVKLIPAIAFGAHGS